MKGTGPIREAVLGAALPRAPHCQHCLTSLPVSVSRTRGGGIYSEREQDDTHTEIYIYICIYFVQSLVYPRAERSTSPRSTSKAPVAKVKANVPIRERRALRGEIPTLSVPAKSAYSALKSNN